MILTVCYYTIPPHKRQAFRRRKLPPLTARATHNFFAAAQTFGMIRRIVTLSAAAVCLAAAMLVLFNFTNAKQAERTARFAQAAHACAATPLQESAQSAEAPADTATQKRLRHCEWFFLRELLRSGMPPVRLPEGDGFLLLFFPLHAKDPHDARTRRPQPPKTEERTQPPAAGTPPKIVDEIDEDAAD